MTATLGIRRFVKGFRSTEPDGRTGYNVRADLSTPWTTTDWRGRREFGFFLVRPVDPEAVDNHHLNALLLGYGGTVGAAGPLSGLRDDLALVDPARDLMVGRALPGGGGARSGYRWATSSWSRSSSGAGEHPPRDRTRTLLGMPQLIEGPTSIPAPGGLVIDEYVGRASSGTAQVSVAHLRAPGGWDEPAQTPAFDEVTVVLHGLVLVEHDGGTVEVRAGQAVLTRAGERVRYSVGDEGAEYVAVCLPAFDPGLANRVS